MDTSAPLPSLMDTSAPEFVLLSKSISEIRSAIPPQYFVRNTLKGLLYLARDLALAACAWSLAVAIDPFFRTRESFLIWSVLRWGAWCVYWWFQGLIFTGIWVLGHECGHGAFSPYKIVNDSIGFVRPYTSLLSLLTVAQVIHSLLFTPYFSWKISHHRHHIYHASMTRDETYVPKTRTELGIPEEDGHIDYDEIFGDTPVYTLFLLIRQQILGFPAYLLFNVSGQKWYSKGTNHFNPTSDLFTPNQWKAVVLSNIGLGVSVCCLAYSISRLGLIAVFKLYLIPWLVVTHWFVMITYLQHTDPRTPHFRGSAWTFQRGAAATVDRPNFLGWQGRFFLHHVVQSHTIHHFFPKIPFYHGPAATEHLKAFLGEHYVSSDMPVFKALWENYNRCQFVEDIGHVVFYKDKRGHAVYKDA
ncbi:fatty acid desaturase-domain-containing protein [Mycena metata]|uniref:Fatty acid desaturase-domain-containing protein n=1 Tax=Mycena metata TaxID=1033252 RepID=A0AAD7JWT7_9AGAR|nr:fatty acid desaturase-domain-containing protein [Mycena metata]